MVQDHSHYTPSKPASRLFLTIDLFKPGRQFGDIMLSWSDNRTPLGFYPIPIICLSNQPGPTVLITGGVHGDEFEGPSAIMRLIRDLSPSDIKGRIIFIPALNMPAFSALSRVSPLDGANLNRAFPGDPLGGPTAMIADFLQREIIPLCDGIIDLHSGGKASVFVPCSLPTQTEDKDLAERNMALAKAMGLPVIWQLGPHNDNRSVNGAAARAGVPMIAAELDGGGGVNPRVTDLVEAGLRRCLKHLGVIGDAPPLPSDANQSIVEIKTPMDHLIAPARGLFDRRVTAGERVKTGQSAGWLHFPEEPSRPSIEIIVQQSGTILAHTTRGLVDRGDMLALIVRDV
jgi:predicted deacylase